MEVYREIEETLGLVPSFMKALPDDVLEHEWKIFRSIQLDEGKVPNKYRELIGIGIAAVSKCRYCTLYHTEAAKLFGATDEEINEALRFAKSSAGWSAYINGLQLDYEEFKDELRRIGNYVTSKMEKREGVAI
jgi:AhpD family alkylhydroperoxidase